MSTPTTSAHNPQRLDTESHVVFVGSKLIFEGDLAATALKIHGLSEARRAKAIILDASTGAELDLDLRGSAREVADRYPPAPVNPESAKPEEGAKSEPRGRGRPRLGVVGREVTLLPRHWEWLDSQRGGCSAALRRLIDEARKARAGEDSVRAAQLRTQGLLTTLAGNDAGFEEALRALYARDAGSFEIHTAGLAQDLMDVARRWAEPVFRTA